MANDQQTLPNAVKLLSEAVVPGGSLLVSGRIGPGLLHTALGLAAGVLLGPVGLVGRLVVSANSYSNSVSSSNLWQAFDSASAQSVPPASPMTPKP
jgi:hypothetical protein